MEFKKLNPPTWEVTGSKAVVAKTVVYRHECECSSASRAIREGHEAEHRFDVDGEPFPWYISVEGPSFKRVGPLVESISADLHPTCYLVTVRIFCALAYTRVVDFGGKTVAELTSPEFSFATSQSGLVIAGKEFPWVISEEGVKYQHARREPASVTLSFFAQHVDADCEIPDDSGLPLQNANQGER